MDYFSAQPNFSKIEIPLGFEWLYHEQYFQSENLLLEIPPLQTFFEPNLPPLTHHYDQLTDFQDFDDFGGGFFFDNAFSSATNCEDTMADKKPQTNYVTSFDHNNINNNNIGDFPSDLCSEVSRMIEIRDIYANLDNNFEEGVTRSSAKRKKCVELELDDIQKYFDVPIKEAAKELGVGVTRLKKRCRELHITRWPHRKFKSLKYLISNVKKMGLDSDEIMMLEEHKRLLEEAPNLELNDKAKRLRQACFKANYKNKRSLAIASV